MVQIEKRRPTAVYAKSILQWSLGDRQFCETAHLILLWRINNNVMLLDLYLVFFCFRRLRVLRYVCRVLWSFCVWPTFFVGRRSSATHSTSLTSWVSLSTRATRLLVPALCRTLAMKLVCVLVQSAWLSTRHRAPSTHSTSKNSSVNLVRWDSSRCYSLLA